MEDMDDYAIHIIPTWWVHTYDLAVSNYDHRNWLRERVLVSFKVVWKLFQELDGIDPRASQVIGKAWVSRDFRVVSAGDSVLVLTEVADQLRVLSSIGHVELSMFLSTRHVEIRRQTQWHVIVLV